jgi:glycine/D-amino acid oxidase-like deaminating enzyme
LSAKRIVVVGAGVFGAATALECRARGWDVVLLDPGPLPHPDASSTDISKIVRMDYGSDVFYHELAELALEGWDRWNADWPRPLFHQDGFLVLACRPLEEGGFEQASWDVLQERGYDAVRIGGSALEARFPAWRGRGYPDGYLSPRAGWVESGEVVARLLALCKAAGVELRGGVAHEVLSHGSRVSGVMTREGETLAADVVAVCAGAWTPSLLPWLSDVLAASAQPVLHFAPADPAPFRPACFPPWAADIAGSGWYGFPALADGRVKVGHHGRGLGVHPDARGEVPDAHVARTRAFMRDALPALADAPVVGRRMCMYCDSFDADFLIDHDPDRNGLVVASGGSGHGFKFAPVIGGIIADVIEGVPNRWASRFRWRAGGEGRREEARYTGE